MSTLTILIPTLPARKHFYDKLTTHLLAQLERNDYHGDVILTPDISTDCSIGVKRNRLMDTVWTDYACFIDDDDRIADNYIKLVMDGIATNPDCCSLNGIITTDGKDHKPFIHSIEYTEFFERDGVYYRCPNHLNTIKTELAKQCPFPDWQRSEDSNFAFQLRDKGLLKTEYKINEVLYY
jgi:hypothetical protein